MSAGTTILVVGALGAIGALIRFALHEGFSRAKKSVRVATVWANTLGSLGLGVIVGADWGPWSLIVGAGLFGALSTLSTLAVDVAELIKTDRRQALIVLSGHVFGGLIAFGLGFALGLVF